MNAFVRLSHQLLGRWTSRQDKALADLQKLLYQAHVEVRADAWLSALWMGSLLAGLGGLLVGALAAALIPGPLAPRLVIPLLAALLVGGWTRALGPLLLKNRATELAKDLDENLPHALNYLLALASAGLTPRDMWGSLARAPIFGPISVEASRIRRDLDVFGHDLLTALRHAQDRTPSRRFAEFLQGAISAFQSGVDLENYLRTKGAQAQRQAIEEQLRSFDSMGIMAEAFLVTVVAAPLFLIILLTVMTVSQGTGALFWAWLLVLVFIPVAQLIVGALVKSMNPKVWT